MAEPRCWHQRAIGAVLAGAALLALPTALLAQASADPGERGGRSLYLEAGLSPDSGARTQSYSLGVLLPSNLLAGLPRQAGPLTLHWNLWVSHWRVPQAFGGHGGQTQIGGLAAWRYAPGGPASPWFAELGLGLTAMDGLYATPQRQFSTRWQFTEVVGLGYRFGAQRSQEISLRFQHFSNGGVKRPNPGENFVRLRWAHAF